ncbi:hypothetical protein IV38_GL000138 [Lactobacillus selangorensis]|uniref:Uncharacterized protein n=2 Tax=Lactobacillus selangorensis TaxID=81857 RepID=A0A0R2FL04_9LACO|nr:hypothetical protein IV38_GL000138 [Lactobacillus selangorensis]KRN29786.1 hypothetical protein IV40_GL000587 [Lactobacillus selangorensis]
MLEFQHLFDQATLYFIYTPDQETATATFQYYFDRLHDEQNKTTHPLGFISQELDLVLPYLSARDNIFWEDSFKNEHQQKFRIRPYDPLTDERFLSTMGRDLTRQQRFYVQLYRNLIARRKLLIMDNLLDGESVAHIRESLTLFREMTQQLGVTMVLLTTNRELIDGNPATSFRTIPFYQPKPKPLTNPIGTLKKASE